MDAGKGKRESDLIFKWVNESNENKIDLVVLST